MAILLAVVSVGIIPLVGEMGVELFPAASVNIWTFLKFAKI